MLCSVLVLPCQVIGITTDWGVEAGMADSHTCDVRSLFSYFSHDKLVGDRRGDMADEVGSEIGGLCSGSEIDMSDTEQHCADGPPMDSSFLFPSSVWVPGTLHIVSDIIEDLTKHLKSFEWWFDLAKAMNNFLNKPWLRELFVAVCLKGEEGAVLSHLFSTFAVKLHHRWGSLVHFIQLVLPLKFALRKFWCSSSMTRGAKAQDRSDSTDSCSNLDNVDKAVNSMFFWAYAEFLLMLCGFAEHLAAWSEGCACHPTKNTEADGLSYFRRQTLIRKQTGLKHPCPMMGRRAPELANGMLEKVVQSASQTYFCFLLQISAQCSEQDRGAVR
jgi:hypothetical protein